ncbi:MAG TPA: hypothetical protein PLQ93_10120 [Bacteroidia bacterium]|nr:hypothetical protein [Bacteroidia bacterium]
MLNTELMDSLRQTLDELRTAENELNRPMEDVVTLSLCVTARKSMSDLMHIYLKINTQHSFKEQSLQDLLEGCKNHDPHFEQVSLGKIYCNSLNHSLCEDKHCLLYNNVEECMKVAGQLKQLVLQKLELNEADLM